MSQYYMEKPASASLEELLNFTEDYNQRMKQLAREQEAQRQQPEKELMLWTAIAGIQYHLDLETEEGAAIFASLTPGTLLKLRREPENKYDHWAIAVDTEDDLNVGYVTRYKNETIARMMDRGHIFEARVEDKRNPESQASESKKTLTEQYLLPFSIWLVS